jgi:Transglycosylase-like domain/LysM domain
MGSHSKPSYTARHKRPSRPARAAAGVVTAAGVTVTTAAVLATPAMAAQDTPVQHPATAEVVVQGDQARAAVTATPARPLLASVRPGDTLSAMAADYCASAARWPGMYAANRDKLSNPNVIYPGQSLRVRCDDTPAPIEAAVPQAQPPGAAAVQAPQTRQAAPRHHYRAASTADAATAVPDAGGSAYDAFPGASCIVQRESGGNPAAENPASTASGLFQDLDSTWNGYDGYARAKDAPASVQVAFNRQLASESGLTPWAADGCPGT